MRVLSLDSSYTFKNQEGPETSRLSYVVAYDFAVRGAQSTSSKLQQLCFCSAQNLFDIDLRTQFFQEEQEQEAQAQVDQVDRTD